MHQVWDTLGTKRGTSFECKQAFFAVFRLGGPRYVLPPVVRSEGVEVYPILIDIGEPATKGSQQRHKPIAISEEELLLGQVPAPPRRFWNVVERGLTSLGNIVSASGPRGSL